MIVQKLIQKIFIISLLIFILTGFANSSKAKVKVNLKEKVVNLKILVHLHQHRRVDVLTWDQVTLLMLPEPVGVVLVIQLQPRKNIIDYINSRGERAYIIIQIILL